MPGILFPDFLEDPKRYSEAEEYWRNLWAKVACSAGQASVWRSPWLTTCFADGTPFRDGNPIFSAVSDQRRLGVRIIQYEADPMDEPAVNWWIDSFGDPAEAGVIRELVVSCAPAVQTEGEVFRLLSGWVSQGAVEPEAEDVTD
jgi:hypothetical protein